jgi:hypothetical protein
VRLAVFIFEEYLRGANTISNKLPKGGFDLPWCLGLSKGLILIS